MTADPVRHALDERVLAWLREEKPLDDDARFEALALELFAHQWRSCPPYARFCEGRGATPDRVHHWTEIPPVPTGAFKEVELRSFDPERTVKTFRTSGTSQGRRGELHLDTLGLYEASLLSSFRRHLLPDLDALGGKIVMHVLAPSSQELPDSSLSHMFSVALASFGAPGSRFEVRDGTLRVEPLLADLEQLDVPALVCGTAFAFVHLLDALAEKSLTLRLPEGSRLMETGGFKGRSREVSRDDLHKALAERLGLPHERIVNQYGMCELASQFYDSTLARPGELRRKQAPPWTRVSLLDPDSGEPVPVGEPGMVTLVDLANTGSVLAVQTADLGIAAGDGFEVLSQLPGAEARGCSIAADEMLAGGA